MKILLDTAAYRLFKRNHPPVMKRVHEAERIYLSTVVRGELLYGFRYGNRTERNIEELIEFEGNPYVSILPVSRDTSDRYGRIAVSLRTRGVPIPTNDIWIAAQAMEVGADLVSPDRHYARVEGIVWIDPS